MIATILKHAAFPLAAALYLLLYPAPDAWKAVSGGQELVTPYGTAFFAMALGYFRWDWLRYLLFAILAIFVAHVASIGYVLTLHSTDTLLLLTPLTGMIAASFVVVYRSSHEPPQGLAARITLLLWAASLGTFANVAASATDLMFPHARIAMTAIFCTALALTPYVTTDTPAAKLVQLVCLLIFAVPAILISGLSADSSDVAFLMQLYGATYSLTAIGVLATAFAASRRARQEAAIVAEIEARRKQA